MDSFEVIEPGAFGDGEVNVPVYLPDRTEVGRAKVDLATGEAIITIAADSKIAELLSESLAGLSIVYYDRDVAEEIINKGEETDGRQTGTEQAPLDS